MSVSKTVPALENLLEHAAFVRRLAEDLVFDEHLARDVEQETWLAALQYAPRHPGTLRSWLAAIVRNAAMKAWRSSRRNAHREHSCSVPEEGVPSPGELLEQEEQRRRLFEHVFALEESLRAVVVLRYFQGCKLRDVARRLGLPVETVRTRTKRALALLRSRLDCEKGGRRAWCLGLVQALELRPSFRWIGARQILSAAFEVMAMGVPHKAASAALVLGLIVSSVYVFNTNSDSPFSRQKDPRTLHHDPPAALDAITPDAPGTPTRIELLRTPEAVEAPNRGPEAQGALVARLTWHDGTPAAGIGVMLCPGEERFDLARQCVTASDGTCRFERLFPGTVRVLLDRNLSREVEVRAGATAEIAFGIPRGNDVEGVVIEADGSPVAGAEICVDLLSDGSTFVLARSGADGCFSIRSVTSKRKSRLFARVALRPPTPSYAVDGGSGHTFKVRFELQATGGALEGTVLDLQGRPVIGAWVQTGDEEANLPVASLPRRNGEPPAPLQLACTDAEGRFRIPGLASGRQAVRVRARGLGPWAGEVEIVESRAERLDVMLLEGTRLVGTVTDWSGRPVTGVTISLTNQTGILRRACRSACDGQYVLEDLPAWEFQVRASFPGQEDIDSTTLDGAPGLLVRWDPKVDLGLTLRGRVVGAGIERTRFHVLVSAVAADGTISGASLTTDPNGRFELAGCRNLPHDIEVGSLDQPMYTLASATNVIPGPDEVVIAVDPARMPTVRLRGRVLDTTGAGLAFMTVSPVCESSEIELGYKTRNDGTFDLGPFPPGRWSVIVKKKNTPLVLLRTPFVDVSANETFDFGDLSTRAGATDSGRIGNY